MNIAAYLALAFRNIVKNKTTSFINVFGLATGFTCCILIAIYIFHEYSYDKHLPGKENIYQLGTTFTDETGEQHALRTSAPVGSMLQEENAEIEASTRALQLFLDDKTLLQAETRNGPGQAFYETNGLVVDSNFFQVIQLPFKEGDAATALRGTNVAVVSETIAKKLFGDGPALDKLVRISSNTHGDTIYRIGGVFEETGRPSHLNANFFLSFSGGQMDEFANNDPSLANNNMFNTYLRLRQGAEPSDLSKKFPLFVQRHLADELKQLGRQRKYFLVQVPDIHLSGIDNGLQPGGSKTALYILASIAVLTLLIACINFMNLATASSAKRATEIGIRKVLGAQRVSLLTQFLFESTLMALLAFLLATGLARLLLPFFEDVAGKDIFLDLRQKLMLGAGFFLLAILTGLLAGVYPAVFLSAFRPIRVLKGRFANSLSAISLRKGLVVFQFVISTVLIIASLVIAGQMRFMRLQDLGFAKEQQIIIPLRSATAQQNMAALRTEAGRVKGVSSVGAGMYYPGSVHPQDWLMYAEGQNARQSKTIFINQVDDNFLQTLSIQPVAGRLFSKDFPADSANRFVINEEAVKQFGFRSPQEAIGKYLAADRGDEQVRFTIVGVVKNFHYKDLHEDIKPLAFRTHPSLNYSYIIATASAGGVKPALAELERAWNTLNVNEPFDYSFLDDDFQRNYERDERQASLITYFTVIAIIISGLGLFGLAAFTAEQRTREIGIRKVLGATASGMVLLLSKDFMKLIIIAALIASPMAWWAMNKWLQNFAYKISIGWEVFAATLGMSILIAFLTISHHAIRAALVNPVKTLRSE